MEDLYSVLGVNKNASQEEIKKRYKELARKWHPDRFSKKSEAEQKEAEEKFKEISAAYDTLGDEQKRKEYDNPLGGGFGGRGFHGFDFGTGGFNFNFGGGNPFDMGSFETNGDDAEVIFDVKIEDIYKGTQSKEFTFKQKVRCKECNGHGTEKWEECPYCHGTGGTVRKQQTPFGISISRTVCPHCHGTGGKGTGKCSKCGGTGFEYVDKTINVDIQYNWIVQDGLTVRIPGEGHQAKSVSGDNGDLHLHIRHMYDINKYRISPNGRDIYQKIDINWYDALLGVKDYELELPDHTKVTFDIPENSAPMRVVEVPNAGMKLSTSTRGKFYITLNYVMPTLSDKQKEILKNIKNA